MRIITLLLVTFFAGLYGQQDTSVWFTTDHGLPQNSVKDIIRDRYGYIWLSTEAGPVRYDGHTFLDTDAVFGNPHFKIFRGSIPGDSIFVVNNEEKEGMMIRKRKAVKIKAFTAAGDWCYPEGKKTNRYYKRNLTEPTPYPFYLIELRTSSYLFSDQRIVYTRNNGSREIRLPFEVKNMKDVFVHGETVFIPDRKTRTLIRVEDGKVSREAGFLYTDQQSVIYWEQITGQVMVINRDTVYLSSYGNHKLHAEKLLHYPGFGNHQFYSMYYDADYRTLYLGSLIKGLNVVKLPDFSSAKKSIPFIDDSFVSTLPFGNDKVITANGYVFNRHALVRKYGFNNSNSNSALFYDSQDNIVCFNSQSIEKYHKKSGYTRKTVCCTGFDVANIFRSGKYYFAVSMENMLVRYPDASFSFADRRYPFSAKINCVTDYRGVLLVGCNDGLFVIDPLKNTVRRMPGIRMGIRNVCKTSDGRCWLLSTCQGFFLLQNGKPVRMPVDEKGFLLFSHNLMEDKKGFLWISTNNGLFRVLKQNLLDYAAKLSTRVFYYRYSTADGLPTNEFNGEGKPCGNALADGSFVFPSIDGLVFFRPESMKSHYPAAGGISIDRVKINDRPVQHFGGALTLENNFGKAEFFIDLPYFAGGENLMMETRTDKTGKWVKADKTRTFLFTEQEPGAHTLSVRVLGDDRGRFHYKTVSVYVKPLFYQTLWFRIVFLAFAVLIVILFIRIRTRNLEQVIFLKDEKIMEVKQTLESREKELKEETTYQEEFFQAITHDIATPIKHLSNLSQMMLDAGNPDLQKKYFDSVYKSTEELYKLTMSLREYREAFNGEIYTQEFYPLRETIDKKIRLFADMADYNRTRIINHTDPGLFLSVKESIISIILQNLLDNAVKNTADGTIAFDARRTDHEVTLTLTDTGKGMPEEQLNYYNHLYASHDDPEMVFRNFGLGLHLVIRLIKKINGHIEFKKQTQGTLVIIKIIDICLKEF